MSFLSELQKYSTFRIKITCNNRFFYRGKVQWVRDGVLCVRDVEADKEENFAFVKISQITAFSVAEVPDKKSGEGV